MAYLAKAGYTAISPDQLADYLQYDKALPPNPVLITFDDGYEDNYQVAYPILQKYHFTATIFLITDFVGETGRYLTWNQVREMSNNGFYFESHTLSHIALTKASENELRSQLVKSKEALEWRLHKKIEYLAYPGGYYDKRVIKLAQQAGYRGAFTINFGRDIRHCGLFTLNRIPIFEGPHTFLHFILRLKFTQAISALQNFKTYLSKNAFAFLANLIYVP
ncbi:polysaccharide deacetylase [Lucifera butyrica]|uniref:Polysaccharide deacetylase n=2 Tax=Lucifera butyrica TaxID=1351585 RepID=A0A498RBW8_9FIRM|nr:polysaccharide deacetylase [Lucifera butyrica]